MPRLFSAANLQGFSWLAAMLNTFFYLPAGLMFLMYYLFSDLPNNPLQQAAGSNALLAATVLCLTVWVNSVLVLLFHGWLSGQPLQRQWVFSALPLVGLAVGAVALAIIFIILMSGNLS